MGMLSSQVIIVIIVILFLIISLYKDLMRPVMIFFIASITFFASGIIDAKDLLSGFANEQIVVVLLLLILSDIIQKTGILDITLKGTFSEKISYKSFLARMLPSIAGVSAFVNNTPLVAIMMPYVYNWAKKKGVSTSKVLIPLSYATILGGTITLVGTSTNLVVNGFTVDAGLKPLGMFDFTYVGIPVTVLGILYLFFIGPRLLPDRKDALSEFSQNSREYLTETQVPAGSTFIGKTVEQAGLRNLRGLFLVEIIRKETKITPAPPTEIIRQDDILIFAGETSTLIDLLKNPNDLILPVHSSMLQQKYAEIVEVVVAGDSPLIGKIVKEGNFRAKFDSAIVGISRNGERISGKIGEVKLRAGDLLLLVTGRDFYVRTEGSGDIYIISKIRELSNFRKEKIWIFAGATLAAFLLPAFGILTLFKTLLLLMVLIAALGIVRLSDLKRSIDVDLFIILALSIGIGKAVSKSGADKLFAENIINLFQPFNSSVAILLGIYLVTNILAMLVTNKAAVAITFPIAIATAAKLGIDPKPFILAVAFAGCAEFMTPYGYQTNLMVYGPGGYKFKDYIRVGWGLTLLFMLTCVGVLGYLYKLY